jgi:hypothetical protein
MGAFITMSHKKLFIVIVALGSVVCALFASSGAIAKQLDAWQLLPKPEPFTALYFNDHQHLPSRIAPGNAVKADATIHNMQHDTTGYRYKITAIGFGTDTEQTLKEGSCTVDHNGTCLIDGSITVPPLAPRVQVRTTIQFEGRRHDEPTKRMHTQSLHYWVDFELPTRSNP